MYIDPQMSLQPSTSHGGFQTCGSSLSVTVPLPFRARNLACACANAASAAGQPGQFITRSISILSALTRTARTMPNATSDIPNEG